MAVTESDDGKVYHLEDIHFDGPNLEIGSPPPGTPYEDIEDWRSVEFLSANGIPTTEQALIEAMRSESDVLLAAAAHASWCFPGTASTLWSLIDGPDDNAGTEAAYALTRQGQADAHDVLRRFLQQPLGAYLSPLLAAGYVAQSGDPSGFGVVREGLESGFLATRMLACKQLFFFLPFQGQIDESGEMVDVVGLFRKALVDDDPNVRDQARGELGLSDSPLAGELLEFGKDR